jgi:hypothetical protein
MSPKILRRCSICKRFHASYRVEDPALGIGYLCYDCWKGRQTMTKEPSVEEFLTTFTPEVFQLALKTRQLVLETLPGILEMVDPPSKIIAYGSSRKYYDLICAIAPYKAHDNLIFSRGVDLPDPGGLLAGTGKQARHIRLNHPEDLSRPGISDLLTAAMDLQKN